PLDILNDSIPMINLIPVTLFKRFFFLPCLALVLLSSVWGCRLWAVMASSESGLYNSGTLDLSYLYQELELLQQQGGIETNPWPYNNNDGWGVAYYYRPGLHLLATSTRSAEPAATDTTLFTGLISSLLSPYSHATIALGHVRSASSGAVDIPDPHPFIFQDSENTYTFIHNGSVDKSTLLNLLTDDEADYSWIDQHPPQTYGYGDWHTDGWDYVIDSELFFLWIVKCIQESEGNVETGINNAVSNLEILRPNDHKNFIFSDGTDLYAYRSNTLLFPNLYYALPSELTSHLAIMSTPPSSNPAGNLNWMPVQDRRVVRFTPSGIVFESGIIGIDSLAQLNEGDWESYKINAYPNPFNSNIMINITIDNFAPPELTIYDINGRMVYQFDNSDKPSNGTLQLNWDGKDFNGNLLSSGMYFVRLNAGSRTGVHKIILIR
ncbi:MAG: class II glutamine amidotransferase, partial [Fidelibacterota bacterium]